MDMTQKTEKQLLTIITRHREAGKLDAPLAVAAEAEIARREVATTTTARVFALCNERPQIARKDIAPALGFQNGSPEAGTCSSAHGFWKRTRHKTYRSTSLVEQPVSIAQEIATNAALAGETEAEAIDLCIDAGVAHGTAFTQTGRVFRAHRRTVKA